MATRRLKRKVRLGFFLLLASGFAVAALGPARQAFEQHRSIENEERKLAALNATNAELEKDLARLNDEDYLETLAREQLGLVRPGEISYIVERPPARAELKPPASPPAPWYERGWDWVFSKLP